MIIITSISNLALSKIKNDSIVSLGGGHNVFNLACAIKQQANLQITLCSPSELTINKCKNIGLEVLPLSAIDHIDLAFDGCDSVDYNFNALKSGGGIHLYEKIAAQISNEYVLLLPKERIQKKLSPKIPLCIEVAEPVARNVLAFCKKLNLEVTIREAKQVASFARSTQGNLLIDAFASNWKDISNINEEISKQNGVVATSYFENSVTSLITTNENKQAVEIKKGDLQ